MSSRHHPNRRDLLLQGAALGAGPVLAAVPAHLAQAQGKDGARTRLKVLFSSAETSFDPARVSDLYSRCVTAHIFESLYTYDYLARPARLIPVLAEALPEASADFRQWTIRVKRGVFFPDDPAFKGQRREVVARDFIYMLQRVVDPANISPHEADIVDLGILGLAAARDAAKASRRFDYDRPIEGLQAVDSHTLRITLDKPRPRMVQMLADHSILGAVAREVVEFYGDKIGEHPVGTGPYRLKSWRRSSRIVLERNPQFRELRYEDLAHPGPDDAEGQALLARYKGRRLPMVDEVEVAIIEEFQPQWLAFQNAEVDALAGTTGKLPSQFAPMAARGNTLLPNLARQGVRMARSLAPDMAFTYFNMQDPVIGGMQPAQVALRRAMSLCYNVEEEIRLIRKGQAIIGQSMVLPHARGWDANFKSEMGDYDPARARALLDMYGFVDRDGDGFRERPDGTPLAIEMASEPEQIYRAYNELWQKCLTAVGIRISFKTQQWPENLKAAQAGKLMMWMLGISGGPDGERSLLSQLYSPLWGDGNFARFKLEAYDRLYEQIQVLPDGPERDALILQAKRMAVAYMPYKAHVHRIETDLTHAWLHGFRRPQFASEWWHMVEVDMAERQRRLGRA
jgi:ABC-type transport system substrate-binding protein